MCTAQPTLYAALRLWQGAEFWFNPELNQGFGLSETHGIAGFTSAEAFKLGADDPYARIQRDNLRQTIDLGGDSEKMDANLNQFAGWQTKDRLVLTLGGFFVTDIFDTNRYANNVGTDFPNWTMNNTATFDFSNVPGNTRWVRLSNGIKGDGHCGPGLSIFQQPFSPSALIMTSSLLHPRGRGILF